MLGTRMKSAMRYMPCSASSSGVSFFAPRRRMLVAPLANASEIEFWPGAKAWRSAARRLHTKSLNQLIRDKLVAEERLRAFRYDEEHTPAELLRIYDYGDLIHWDRERSPELAAFEQDPFTASDRRLAFLDAASGLAHLYIGFAELARAAIGRIIAA